MIKLLQRTIRHKKDIADYSQYNSAQVKQIKRLANKLRNKKIIHINATAEGGGVVELLEGQVALERSLGLQSKWFYIDAPTPFFKVTKKIHNLLQGEPINLTSVEQKLYLSMSKKLGVVLNKLLDQEQPDVIVVHDPQPIAVIKDSPFKSKMISRIHGDLSKPNPKIIKFLEPFINQYQQIIVSSKNFIPSLPPAARKRASVIMPAIDPNSNKNIPMPLKQAQIILKHLGLNPAHPIICQVSRFDPWKDPVGVVQAYQLARKTFPNLQLVLAGIMNAKDDPQAVEILLDVKKVVNDDDQVILITDQKQLGQYSVNQMVNAVFTASNVVLQKSLKEGFGLTITEAMWKGKTVIGGTAQGVKLQIKNNVNGLIVGNIKGAGHSIVKLLSNKKLCSKLGKAAKTSVKQQFLLPRYLLQNLESYSKVK